MPDDKNAQPNTEKPATQPPKQPPIIPISPTVPSPQADEPHPDNIHTSTKNHPEPSQHWFRSPDWWMVITAGILTAIGIITACIFYGQFQQMATQTGILNRQAKQAAVDSGEAGKRIEQQLEISEEQAKAAQDSAAAIQNQMRQDQRAWVVPTFPIQNRGESPLGTMTADILISNIGKTPARDVHLATIGIIIEKGQALTFDYKWAFPLNIGSFFPPNFPKHYGIPIIQPTPAGKPVGIVFDGVLQNKLQRGEIYIFGYGRITYKDIFSNQPHWVNFCEVLNGAFASEGPQIPTLEKQCNDYNRGDESK